MHYAATVSNILPISVNKKIEPSPYFQVTGETILSNNLVHSRIKDIQLYKIMQRRTNII